jgi:large subunit ribosomal protein L10
MNRTNKAVTREKLGDVFSQGKVSIVTDYRGLKTPELNVIRRKMREAGAEFHVVKNTLARYAVEKTGSPEAKSLLKGPVAVAVGHDDLSAPARALLDHIRSSKSTLSIRGGFMANRMLTVEDVTALSILPSRDILLARVLGGMQSPLVKLVSTLQNPIRGLAAVLAARAKQMEAAPAAAADAVAAPPVAA